MSGIEERKGRMTRLVRTLVALSVMVAAVAIYAGVATGHNSGGNGHGDRHGGKHRGNAVLKASLAPSQIGDPTFHGVGPGGAPWVLKRGSVELKSKGRLELRVRGLVIPPPTGNGTPGPVTTINASLYCGDNADTTAADTSDTVPLDQHGNARIRDKSFTVPPTCLAPVILVHPNGVPTAYIAVDGWRSS
jgi:hypothetical protein